MKKIQIPEFNNLSEMEHFVEQHSENLKLEFLESTNKWTKQYIRHQYSGVDQDTLDSINENSPSIIHCNCCEHIMDEEDYCPECDE